MPDDAPPEAIPPSRSPRYYDAVVAGFVCVLLCANTIGPGKVVEVWGASFAVGNVFFPISYILGDVLTEVYGYARARRAVWLGFGALIFATVMTLVVVNAPPDPAVEFNARMQPALEVVFGSTWRIVVASMLAFVVGDLLNSYVMAKMKVLTRGRHLWTRTIGSTVVGQGADSLIFYPVAFLWVWSDGHVVELMITSWIFKTLVEVVMTPLTYVVVRKLKTAEQQDPFDVDTDFTPFSWRA